MKKILYYLLLLIFIALLSGFLMFGRADSMSMSQMLGVSAFLILYTIAMSLVGNAGLADERDVLHRNLANRPGWLAGLLVMCLGGFVPCEQTLKTLKKQKSRICSMAVAG